MKTRKLEWNRAVWTLAALALSFALTVPLSGCGGGESAPPPSDGAASTEPERVVNLAFTTAWGDFNPYYTTSGTMYELALYDKIYDKLAFMDMAGAELLPRAAESWESTDSGRGIVFHLDPRARWSDGTPCTAKDWVFTVNLLADPASAFTTRVFTQLLKGTDSGGKTVSGSGLGAEAPDDYTLKLTFKDPVDPEDFLVRYNREFLVLPEHLLGGADPASILDDSFWQNPVGSGPCVYVSQVTGAEMILSPNPYYHLWAGNWDKLVLRVVDSSSRLTAFMAGEIDAIVLGSDITADDIPLAQSHGLTVRDAEVRNFFMEVRIAEKNIRSPRIRQALHLAVDKDAVIAAAAKDVGVPAYSYEMLNSDYYDPSLEFSRDVEKAKALLSDAGYDGRTYTIAFASKRQNMAALLAQQWEEAGIHVEMVMVDVATMFAGLASGTYDMGISAHTATTYSLWFEDEFPADDNPVLDPPRMNYVYRIRAAVDDGEKAELVKEYQRYLAERTYFIPLYFSGSYWIESNRVSGIRNSASMLCNDNVWEWVVNDG